MKSRVVVTVIIKNGDKYLLGQKPNNIGPYPNTWHLIGGGVDLENESLEEAMRREVREEAGIEIENLKIDSFDEDYEPDKKGEMTHYVFLRFRADYKSGEIKAGDDIHELKWIPESELKSIPLTRPLIKLFKQTGII